jgi:hypothetical protein
VGWQPPVRGNTWCEPACELSRQSWGTGLSSSRRQTEAAGQQQAQHSGSAAAHAP